jgi:hypothetical protein
MTQAIYDYARPVVTGSVAISCEYEGDIYIAVCERPGEAMTMAGTTMRLNYPDGTQNPAGPADVSPLAAALRSAKDLFGLGAETHPELLNAKQLTEARCIGPNKNTNDSSQPQRGYGDNPEITQIGMDYAAHLGTVEKLPELTGQDTVRGGDAVKSTWMNIRNVEKVSGDNKVFYQYNGDDNPIIPKDTEVLPIGGMHIVEALVKHVRDLPFKAQGINGVEGHVFQQMKANNVNLRRKLEGAVVEGIMDQDFKPATQAGHKIAELYDSLTTDLAKSQGRNR